MGHQGLNILTLIETKIEPLSLKFSILEEKFKSNVLAKSRALARPISGKLIQDTYQE